MRKKLSVMTSLLLALSLLFSVTSFAAAKQTSEIKMKVEGKSVSFPDGKPYEDKAGRIQTPVRYLAEALGLSVNWDNGSQTVTFTPKDSAKGKSISLTVGQDWYDTAGVSYEMDTTATMKDGRVYAPVRFISEAFGVGVKWDSKTNTVNLGGEASNASKKVKQFKAEVVAGTGKTPLTIKSYSNATDLAKVLEPYAIELFKSFAEYLKSPEDEYVRFSEFLDKHLSLQEDDDPRDNRELSEFFFETSKSIEVDLYSASTLAKYGDALLKVERVPAGNVDVWENKRVYVYHRYKVTINGKMFEFTSALGFYPSEKDSRQLVLTAADVGMNTFRY